jgi:hypothetical protein
MATFMGEIHESREHVDEDQVEILENTKFLRV